MLRLGEFARTRTFYLPTIKYKTQKFPSFTPHSLPLHHHQQHRDEQTKFLNISRLDLRLRLLFSRVSFRLTFRGRYARSEFICEAYFYFTWVIVNRKTINPKSSKWGKQKQTTDNTIWIFRVNFSSACSWLMMKTPFEWPGEEGGGGVKWTKWTSKSE